MGKREKVRRMKDEGLHEIKNKYRMRAVNKKRKGLVFTAKKKRRMLKAGASLSAMFLLILGAFAVGSALLSNIVPNEVPDDFATVCYELPTDGSQPSDHSALENIGYMNYRFKHQPNWYAEMHGTTSTPVGPQSVNTIKQFSDNVLIMADVTSSSLINAGRQFCYANDEVMWRELPKNSSFKMDSYEDMQALTFNDELKAHMTIPAFKKKNGLPGTEFTVYVINEATLEGASEIEKITTPFVATYANGEESFVNKPVYRQTYYLRPGDSEDLGAAAHYANQMAFTGGLTGLPEFNYITVTYTFDSSWQVLRAEIDESYKATMGITVTCSSDFTTNYEYQTEKAKNPVYEEFFKSFVGQGIDDNVEKPLDSLNCITSAFLTKPVTFELGLEVNGKKTDGVIALDASKLDIGKIASGGSVDIGAALGCIGLKAKIGEIYAYLEDSTAYLMAGDLKAKLPVDKLLSMITGGEAKAASELAEEGEKEEAAVFDLGDPVVKEEGGARFAYVSAKLDLSSLGVDLVMPLDFKFKLDEEQNASLETLDASLSYQGIKAKIGLKNTSKTVPELKNKDSFIDLYPYAEAVYDLIDQKQLEVVLGYGNADMTLGGNIAIDFTSGLRLAGALSLDVRGSRKTVGFAVEESEVYLNLDGIKISANAGEAMEIVKGFLAAPKKTGEEGDSTFVQALNKVLNAVFERDLASLISLNEEENALTLGVKGTELLAAFGLDFELGDVNLSVKKSGEVSAAAYGASVALKAGRDVVIDKQGYVDITPYAASVANLIKQNRVNLGLAFEKKLGGAALSVNGDVALSLSPIAVSGELCIRYGALEKNIAIVYGEDGYVYLTLDGAKIKASGAEAAKLVSSLLTKSGNEKEKTDVYEILKDVLAVDFGEILSVSESLKEAEEEGRTLNVAIDGTKLLNLFGVKFELGGVALTVSGQEVTASAFGATLSLTAGGNVKALTESEKKTYVDLKPVLDALPDLLDKKALSLSGEIVLGVGDKDFALLLNRGMLSFESGVELYLDASLVLSEATLKLQLLVDTAGVKIALGNFGAELKYSDFSALGGEILSLYNEVRNTLNPISEKELLPEAKTIDDLFNLLKSLFATDDSGLDTVLSKISMENSSKEGGLFAVKFAGLTLDIVKEARGFIGARFNLASDALTVTGSVSTAVYAPEPAEEGEETPRAIPALPDTISYLNKNDFVELLDYLAAAVHTLAENNINLTVSGVIGSDDKENYPDGVKYNLSGDIRLYSGKNTAVHLNLDKKSLWVDTDTYLYAKVDLTPVSENDKGIYLEFFLLDCDEEGNADGSVLDAFVSVSLRKNGTASAPLTLYAPATEIMPLLSSLLSFVGMDEGVLGDFVVTPWISSLETRAQLKGFGQSILQMISALTGGTEEAQTRALNLNSIVSSIEVGAESFELALSSEAIFNKAGAPLTLTLSKERAENGSRLTGVAVSNIGNTRVSLGVDYDKNEKITPAFKGMIPMNGVASLLQTIARSTTHAANGEVISGEAQKHEYLLNENFYIDGSILLDINAAGLLKEKLHIKVVAFSITIDEDGVWGVNVRFEYDGLSVLGITAINGNTQVDLTGKDNMVYIKRVQTTDASGKPFAKPAVVYRAMPLKNFVNDLIGQAGFLFNLGSKITDLLGGIKTDGNNTKEEVDLGATVGNLLKAIEYTEADAGESWKITLNGAALTKELGDIVVTLASDEKGLLRTLTAHASLSTTGISLTVDADLTYRNPCGVMDSGVTDITTDIAALLTDGMSYKLSVVDWESTAFIEGDYTSVDYILAGSVIKTQDIVISTGAAGDAKGTVYGTLSYPELTPYQTEKGYRAEWDTVYGKDDALPESRQIFASYRPLTYELIFDFGNGESETLAYEYGNQEFSLPFRENEIERVAFFTDEEGNEYRTAEDLKNLSGDTRLTAVYEDVSYTVTFVLGDTTKEQIAAYGEAVIYPASPEKTGYTFAGWDVTPETVTQNITITALWTAREYRITFVSDYLIEGYSWTANEGGYTAEFTFVYGEEVALPRDVRALDGDKQFVLRGFCTQQGGTCYFDKLPNVTEDTVFYAQWQERGFDIRFVAEDGNETVLNYRGGEKIPVEAIPAVAAKEGYTGVWADEAGNPISANYTVTGEATFTAAYTPNTYQVSLVSSMPYAGFTAADGEYVKTLYYTYNGTEVTLGALNDISGYWFKGYYTEANGEGEKVESVDRITKDLRVYVYWQDNTVTIRIYSDVRFENSVQDLSKNGFYQEYSFNDTYDLTEDVMPTAAGYQTLALFRLGDSWEKVDNVKDLNGAELWVFWIQDIRVKITEFYTNNVAGGSAYNIGGTVEGALPFGKMSNLIYEALGMSKHTTTEATFYIRGASEGDSVDNCGGKKTISVSYENGSVVGTFLGENMNSWDYRDILPAPRATYGGVVITKTFKYGGKTIATTNGAVVSLDTYTVSYVVDGTTIKVEGLRADCPFDEYDCRIFVDELAAANGITVPAREGYTGAWRHEEVRGNMTVQPEYTPVICSATLRGGVEFKDAYGWQYDHLEDDYFTVVDICYGAMVSVIYRGETVAAYQVGLGENVFDLSADVSGKILYRYEATLNSVTVELQNNPDTLVMNSPVAFTLDGATQASHQASFDTDYSLPTPEKEGYLFLGWFELKNGAWAELTTIAYSGGGNAVTVEALWQQNGALSMSELAVHKDGNKYSGSVAVSGGHTYIGACANEVTARAHYEYSVRDKNGNHPALPYLDGTTDADYAVGQSNRNTSGNLGSKIINYGYIKVSATVTYYLRGRQISVLTVEAHTY